VRFVLFAPWFSLKNRGAKRKINLKTVIFCSNFTYFVHSKFLLAPVSCGFEAAMPQRIGHPWPQSNPSNISPAWE
jgi:hypothetical protein